MVENTTETALNRVINNPLVQQTKTTDLEQTISSFSSSKTPDANQITIAMDKFENKLIKKRKVK